MKFLTALMIALTVFPCLAAEKDMPKENLVKNGDFSSVDDQGKLKDWERQKNEVVQTEGDTKTLVLTGSYATVSQNIKIDPSWGVLHLSMQMKATDVVKGDAIWKDARLAMAFKGADGKRAGNWPSIFSTKGTTDWISCERDYPIPEGAVSLEISPANFGASGTIAFRNIILTVASLKGAKPEGKPVIILKLDDVTKVTPNWQKCVGFLKEQKVKASLGIIGHGLEKDDAKLVEWIKKLHESKQFEFWNHGYKNRTSADKQGEFEIDSEEEQLKSLKRTQELAKEKLGITLQVFGPHWSGTNKSTEAALKKIPEIKSVFYYTKAKDAHWFVFQRWQNLEIPTFCPNPDKFISKFNSIGNKKPYLCLQGHPNSWYKPERFENFKKIVKFLKEHGCEFMTASEYIDSIKKSKEEKKESKAEPVKP